MPESEIAKSPAAGGTRRKPDLHGSPVEYVPDLVSVIIPTYNRKAMLARAIASVRAQTYRPIELIVVDDGSDDGTGNCVAAWQQSWQDDPQFECHYLYQENKGAPAARNFGLRCSRGEYVQFLDTDDLLHPLKIERQVSSFRQNDAIDAVVCQTLWLNSCLVPVLVTRFSCDSEATDMASYMVGHSIPINAPLHKHCSLDTVNGFLDDLPCGQEFDLHLRLAFSGGRFLFVPDLLNIVHMHRMDQRITDKFRTNPADFELRFYDRTIEVAERYHNCTDQFRSAVARKLLCLGCDYYARSDPESGFQYMVAAARLCPGIGVFRRRVYSRPVGQVLASPIERVGAFLKRVGLALDRRLSLYLRRSRIADCLSETASLLQTSVGRCSPR